MVLVESEAEPYHFVEREIRKTLEWAREWFISLLNVVTDIVGCLSFTFLLPNSFSLCLNDAPPVTARTIFNAFLNLRRKRRNVWRFHSICGVSCIFLLSDLSYLIFPDFLTRDPNLIMIWAGREKWNLKFPNIEYCQIQLCDWYDGGTGTPQQPGNRADLVNWDNERVSSLTVTVRRRSISFYLSDVPRPIISPPPPL